MILDHNDLAAMQRRYDEQEAPGYFDSTPDETERDHSIPLDGSELDFMDEEYDCN